MFPPSALVFVNFQFVFLIGKQPSVWCKENTVRMYLGKLLFSNLFLLTIQECIHIGCVSTVVVAATRCQYQGVPTSPGAETPSLGAETPSIGVETHPVNRMTHASGNINFPCGR